MLFYFVKILSVYSERASLRAQVVGGGAAEERESHGDSPRGMEPDEGLDRTTLRP